MQNILNKYNFQKSIWRRNVDQNQTQLSFKHLWIYEFKINYKAITKGIKGPDDTCQGVLEAIMGPQGSPLRPARLPEAGKNISGQVKVPGHLPCKVLNVNVKPWQSKLQVKSKQGVSGIVEKGGDI